MIRITNTCDADLVAHTPSGVVMIKAKQSMEVTPKTSKEIADSCENYIAAGLLLIEGRDITAEAKAKSEAEAMAKAQADAETEAKAKSTVKK
jgi:hypothetical protein